MTRWLSMLLLGACSFQGRAELIDPDAVPPGDALAGDALSIDAGDPPGSYCLGDSIVRICLAEMPTTSLTITNTAIKTDASSSDCATNVVGANMDLYCVLAGAGITVSGGQVLSAKGSRPLVLVSSGTLTVNGTIDVAGHLGGAPQSTGAAGDSSSCTGATPPAGGGGGYGGGFGASGGGIGGFGDNGLGGLPPSPVASPQTLRGGCAGSDGAGSGSGGGDGGHSGGAVALIAATSITLSGGVINASGAGGGKGTGGQSTGKGGGGGGSGGMIVIDALTVMGDGGTKIFANGGSGGGGGDDNQNDGHDGADAPTDPTMAAMGGAGASSDSAGGNGSKANGLLTNAPGTGAAGFTADGGGGGGGGAGVIKLFKASSVAGTMAGSISPPPT